MKVCPNCGKEAPAGARVCPFCSATLPQSEAPDNAQDPAQSTPTSEQSQPGPPQPGTFNQQPYGAPYVVVRTTEGQAIGALVCGILGVVTCPIVLSIVAIVLSRKSLRAIEESGGALEGEGMAKAGNILGIIGLVFWGLWLLLMLLVIAGGIFASVSDGSF